MGQHTDSKSSTARIGAAAAAGLLLILAAGAAWLKAAPPLREGLAFSPARFDEHGRLLELARAADGAYRVWTPLREVSPLATSVASLRTGLQPRGLRERARLTLAALRLRALYSREELLEAYLNLADYGGAIRGA